MRIREKFNKKLLVEGSDDQHVIWALCEKFQIPENFDVIDCEGIENLIAQIPVRLKQSDIETVGIIIDADLDLEGRWDSILNILSKAGFNIPGQFPKEGLIHNENNIGIGIWIMPNNTVNGMLEDFISFLVPQNDALLTVAGKTLKSIENEKLNKYSLNHKSKALIHSWLSWQSDPGTPLGLAITKKYLSIEEPICRQLIKWLINTFTS